VEPEQTSQFKEVREALSKGELHGMTHPSSETLLFVARAIASGGTEVDELLVLAFPEGVPVTINFFDCLRLVERRLGFSEAAHTLTGELGAYALEKLTEPERLEVLRYLPSKENKDLFGSLRLLPLLIERINFSAEFLLPWFLEVRTRIGNDQAQGDYWRSLKVWALKHSSSAFDGLRLLCCQSLDDDKISMGACLLGHLRIVWANETPSPDGISFETGLATHGDAQKRLIFYRSWINTGWHRELSSAEFIACLSQISKETGEERLEGFNFLRCLLPSKSKETELLESGLEWLRSNVSPGIQANSKHWVVNIVKSLAEQALSDSALLERIWPLLVSVQPIQKENGGTWQELEFLLVKLLEKNPIQFQKLLFLLLDANPEGLRHRFEAHQSFDYLLSQIAAHPEKSFYAGLFFSPLRYRREFAFALFDELPFSEFPAGMLPAKSDDEIALALLEFQQHLLQPDHTLMFLKSFLGRMKNASQQVVDLYKAELLRGSKNLHIAVLDKLKAEVEKSELIRSVVAEAEIYFNNVQKTHQTAINAMQIPGLWRALSMSARRQSKEVATKTEELSILRHFCNNSYLLYGGKQFRYVHDGELRELSELKKFSTSMELPRLEMIDPEGAAIRRHYALKDIRRLEMALTGVEVPDEP
jgi:hypothetical protein